MFSPYVGVAVLHSVPNKDKNSLHLDEKCEIKILFFYVTLTGLFLCCD